MLIIEIAILDFISGHIGIILFLEIAKLELTGGLFEIMLVIEIEKKLSAAILEICYL